MAFVVAQFKLNPQSSCILLTITICHLWLYLRSPLSDSLVTGHTTSPSGLLRSETCPAVDQQQQQQQWMRQGCNNILHQRGDGPKLLIPIWSGERISVTNTLNYHNQSLRLLIHSFCSSPAPPTLIISIHLMPIQSITVAGLIRRQRSATAYWWLALG